MKARIAPRFAAFSHDIWLYDEDPVENCFRLYRPQADGEIRVETIPNGAHWPEPSLTLPSEMLEAIVAACADHLPPSSAQAAHLADAIGIRDRLLTLVEGSQQST